jgi:hypothetical protein
MTRLANKIPIWIGIDMAPEAIPAKPIHSFGERALVDRRAVLRNGEFEELPVMGQIIEPFGCFTMTSVGKTRTDVSLLMQPKEWSVTGIGASLSARAADAKLNERQTRLRIPYFMRSSLVVWAVFTHGGCAHHGRAGPG